MDNTSLKFYRVDTRPTTADVGSVYFVLNGDNPGLWIYQASGWQAYTPQSYIQADDIPQIISGDVSPTLLYDTQSKTNVFPITKVEHVIDLHTISELQIDYVVGEVKSLRVEDPNGAIQVGEQIGLPVYLESTHALDPDEFACSVTMPEVVYAHLDLNAHTLYVTGKSAGKSDIIIHSEYYDVNYGLEIKVTN